MPIDGDGRILAALAMVTQLGFIMAAAITAGLLGGMWLDAKLGTTPYLLVLCLLIGIAGGTITAYRMIMHAIQETQPENDEEG